MTPVRCLFFRRGVTGWTGQNTLVHPKDLLTARKIRKIMIMLQLRDQGVGLAAGVGASTGVAVGFGMAAWPGVTVEVGRPPI